MVVVSLLLSDLSCGSSLDSGELIVTWTEMLTFQMAKQPHTVEKHFSPKLKVIFKPVLSTLRGD
jgi:hypothetical protein